jgi:hypothetical protein
MSWTVVLAAIVAVAKWLASYFSAEARLRRREVDEARAQGREAVEAERLESTYRRIQAEPSVAQPAEALNERLRKLRERQARREGGR